MRTTIDKAGRIVLPKALRDQVGIVPGEVEVVAHGASLVIEPITTSELEEVDGVLVLPHGGVTMTVEQVRELRLADQR